MHTLKITFLFILNRYRNYKASKENALDIQYFEIHIAVKISLDNFKHKIGNLVLIFYQLCIYTYIISFCNTLNLSHFRYPSFILQFLEQNFCSMNVYKAKLLCYLNYMFRFLKTTYADWKKKGNISMTLIYYFSEQITLF